MDSNNRHHILNALSQPFHPSHITWKPGVVKQNKALALAYADLRAYQQRLDEVCGLDWSVSYTPWGDRIVCHLTIEGVTRSSTGEPDSQSERSQIAGTAAEAQAFKRACAMFGLGRYLYSLPSIWAEWDQEKRRFSQASQARLNLIVAQHYRRHVDADAESEASPPVSEQGAIAVRNGSGVKANGTPINSQVPNAYGAEQNGQAKQAKDAEGITAGQVNELQDLARLYYEDAWAGELKRLTRHVSSGRTDDPTHLQPSEAARLIAGLMQKLQERPSALS